MGDGRNIMAQQFDAHAFRETAREALVASSAYIRDAILGEVDLSAYLFKGDKTAVTVVDQGSQDRALPIIQRGLGQYRINAEEAPADSGSLGSSIHAYFDSLDGTGGFLMGGATPTVILGAYDTGSKQVLTAATMETTTGRFWFSAKGRGAWLNRFDYESGKWTSEDGRRLHVNQQGLQKGAVLVDVNHAFAREDGKRPVLYADGRRALTSWIEAAGSKESTFYTNGGHYALSATGRPTLVGNITTAIGGPYDVIGLLHVIEAGGSAQAYRIEEVEGSRVLQPIGHDIEAADLVIAANSKDNVQRLEDILRVAVKYRQ